MFKKINLVAVNSKFIHSSLAVLSLKNMYCKYSEQFGYRMPILSSVELTINENFDSLLYSVMDSADIYAFSVYIWNNSVVKRLCKYIKSAKPDSKIILGGPEVSYGDVDIECDYIVSGEGERAFFSLICELCGYDVPENWNYTANGKFRFCSNVENLDEFSLPYSDENIDCFKNKIIYYESSRGCPFSCVYCLSSACGKVRTLPLERVFNDIDFFIKHNVNQVKFVDRTFNFDRTRTYEIWNYIINNSEKSDTNFHFEVGADLLDDKLIDLLSKAPIGKIQLEAGIQSTYGPALDECCRHTETEKLFSNLCSLREKNNINIHIDLIAGLPYETFDIFKKSFNDSYKLKAHQLQLGFLKLLRGTPLNKMLDKHGYIFLDFPPYEVVKNKFISDEELRILKKIEDVLERFYNSGRFHDTLEIAEKLYDTPFEMYNDFSVNFEKSGLMFQPVSTKALYDFLSKLLKTKGLNGDKELLLDFYLSEKSDVVPIELRYLANKRDKSGMILKNSSQCKNNKAQVKFIENTAYIIDYSARNKVDGRFCLKEVISDV